MGESENESDGYMYASREGREGGGGQLGRGTVPRQN